MDSFAQEERTNLKLTLKPGDSIEVGEAWSLTLLRVDHAHVAVSVQAPRGLNVRRIHGPRQPGPRAAGPNSRSQPAAGTMPPHTT
jgi:hypothetical protein